MEDTFDKIPTNFSEKTDQKYRCEICDYNTSKKSTYYTHLKSVKHKKMLLVEKHLPKPDQCFECICGKNNLQHELWKHTLITLFKENVDLKKQMVEQSAAIVEIAKNISNNKNN